jgi:hypothetical protein
MNILSKSDGLPPAIDYANLEAHPLADQFDMIKDGDDGGAAFEAFKASIAREGIKLPIKLFEGKILDGRNRYRAAKLVGHKFTARDFETFIGTYVEAKAYVDALNIHRRHHSAEQKEKLVKAKIAEHPNASARQISRMCGVSHTLVNKIKDEMSGPSEDDRKLKSFEKTWNDLSDQLRERFVQKYAVDIRELLGLPETVSTRKP